MFKISSLLYSPRACACSMFQWYMEYGWLLHSGTLCSLEWYVEWIWVLLAFVAREWWISMYMVWMNGLPRRIRPWHLFWRLPVRSVDGHAYFLVLFLFVKWSSSNFAIHVYTYIFCLIEILMLSIVGRSVTYCWKCINVIWLFWSRDLLFCVGHLVVDHTYVNADVCGWWYSHELYIFLDWAYSSACVFRGVSFAGKGIWTESQQCTPSEFLGIL